MKLKYYLLSLILCLSYLSVFSQNVEPFKSVYNEKLKGDVLMIGNNLLSFDKTEAYNGNTANHEASVRFVDMDGDKTTTNSSSARLSVPNNSVACYRVKYAALYWAATYDTQNRSNITDIKFKVPGGSYTNVKGQLIYDEYPKLLIPVQGHFPYAAYADVTNLINPTNAEGDYFVADIKATQGLETNAGYSAGWHLFIVYEDPKLTSKYITTFNGFTGVSKTSEQIIDITGFKTIPIGNVKTKVGFAALEGDRIISGDKMDIRGVNTSPSFTAFSPSPRSSNNVFDSSFSDTGGNYINRNPASQNTLGYDAGIDFISGPANTVIGNNETAAKIKISSTGDVYDFFFTAFTTEIIEPKILLTKQVLNLAGNDIGNSTVTLCEDLRYHFTFDNIGNDDAIGVDNQPAPYGKDYILIRDLLPANVTYLGYTTTVPSEISKIKVVQNPTNPRELFIYVHKDFVKVAEASHSFTLNVKLVCSCLDLQDACNNEIKNQAFATYQGATSGQIITDDPSYSSVATCLTGQATSTNFLAIPTTCLNFTQQVFLCASTVDLTAPNGFTSYTWTGPAGATISPNTSSQTVTVNMPGTYTVTGTSASCLPVTKTFNVTSFASTYPNPFIKYDESQNPIICTSSGARIPYIYLCNATDSQLLDTGITNATVEWFKYDETVTGCGPYPPTNCPVTLDNNPGCWLNKLYTGQSYTVTDPGKYAIKISLPGSNCPPLYYYFNVYKNDQAVTVVTENIICNTPGRITVNGLNTTDFEYQLVNNVGVVVFPWQNSNVFNIPNTGAGTYTVQVRPKGITPLCAIPNATVGISVQNDTTTAQVTQPVCFGQQGSVLITIANVPGPFNYILHTGSLTGPIVGQSIASSANNFTFGNLTPGVTYFWETSTAKGCARNGSFTINNPAQLQASLAVQPITSCNGTTVNGSITVTASGGTPPYYYYYEFGPPNPSIGNVIPISTAGSHKVIVYDNAGCNITISQVVPKIDPPVFSISVDDVKCYGDNTGKITFNVTNANGNTIRYSIDGGVTFSGSNVFANLPEGTYNTVLEYTYGTAVCRVTATKTIAQPTQALTAAGGVMSIACAPSGQGIIRITNVQGGTPFAGTPPYYEYNFGQGWVTTNQASVFPGTHTIFVRDANGCQYPMTVNLDPIPPAPSIDVPTPTFNCDGTATSTVTVTPDPTSSAAYNLTYSIIPALNPPHNPTSNVFQNVPCGNSTITVNYTLVNPPTFSNLLKETFGSGPDGDSPGASTNFCRKIQGDVNSCTKGKLAIFWGEYVVTSAMHPASYSGWKPFPTDHTGNPGGRFFVTDIGTAIKPNDVLYKKRIVDIIPNQPIIAEIWIRNLGHNNEPLPRINLTLDLPTGGILSTTSTGLVPENGQWNKYTVNLNPGANTTLDFSVRIANPGNAGIDFALDDISVYQLPIACTTTRTFPINIECGKAFTAKITGKKDVSCNGANDAYVTVDAQNFDPTKGFQVSMNNGASWTTYMTSPQNVPVPPAGYTGTVLVRFDSTTTATSPCYITLTKPIVEPTRLTNVAAIKTLPTCLVGATLEATVTGGTLAYQYQLELSGGGIVTAYQNSNQFTNVAQGSYIIRVKDGNGCLLPSNIVVVGVSPKPTLNIVSSSCYNGNTASIVVNATGGTPGYQYSIDGGAFSPVIAAGTNHTFNVNVTPKTYTIVVKDANGCTDTKTQLINAELTATASVAKDIDCTPGNPDGLIQVTINNGNPGYSYQVSINGAPYTPAIAQATGTPFTYTIPATIPATTTYQFQITDSKGCTAITNIIKVQPLGTIVANVTRTNITCNGLTNGSVTFAPSGGVAPYQINFNNQGFSTTLSYSGLSPNIAYPYVIQDKKLCTFNGTVTLSQPVPLTATASMTKDFTCDGKGEITVTVTSAGTAGAGFPQFSIDGGLTWTNNPIIGNLDPGTYTVLVKDANNCTYTINPSITITPLNRPTDLTVTPLTNLTCPAKTINVQLAAVGGFGVLDYAITAPFAFAQNNATGTFNNLSPNTYTFEITDSKNCKYSEQYTIIDLLPVTATSLVKANVKCKGEANGSAEITVGGFGANYDYTVVGPTPSTGTSAISPLVLTNLLAGNYTVTIKNTTTNCTGTTTFVIAEPVIALDATLTPNAVTCTTGTGSITVNATGGWGNYTYAISPVAGNQAGNVFTNLPANTYTITITDANGCQTQKDQRLDPPTQPNISIDVTSDYCYDPINQATITVNGSGGVPLYQYSMNGGVFGLINTFTNLGPGSYTFTVKDAFGCTRSTVAQTIAPQLKATSVLTKTYDCTATPDAVITVTIADGYPDYVSYRVRYNAGAYSAPVLLPAAATSFTYPVLVANPGTYEFEITDAKGCTTTTSITVAPRSLPVLTVTPVNQALKCFGDATGVVTWSVVGGTPNYTINVVNTTTGVVYGTQTSGLPAGNYTITVTDAKSCSDTKNFTITQPNEITFTPVINSITCNTASVGSGYTKGSICINTDLAGGTLPITFVLKDASGNAVGAPIVVNTLPLAAQVCFPNIDYGVYSITATDANLCSKVINNQVMSSPVSALTFTYIATPSCSNATLQVDITGGVIGVGNYQFGIVDSPNPPFASQFYNANNGTSSMIFSSALVPPLPIPIVPGGNYTIVVRDLVTDCYHFQQAPIPATSINPTPTITPVPVTCKGNNDGKLEISVANLSAGVTQFSYQIIDAATNLIKVPTTTVTAPFAFPYVVSNLTPGNYNVFIIEVDGPNAGCGKTFGPFEIKESAMPLTLTASTTNDNCNTNAGTVTAMPQGGTGPYLYQIFTDSGVVGVIDGTDPVVTNPVFSASFNSPLHTPNVFNVESGNYIVYVKDAYGCITSAFATVGLDPTPVVAATLNNACAAQGSYQIDVTLPTLGVPPYSFSLTQNGVAGPFVPNTAPFSYSNLNSGTYQVTVKDKNGCGNTTAAITILAPLVASASFTTAPSCNNSDGTITVTASDGSGNYEYRIIPGAFQASNVFINQAPGNYTIEVRDTTTGCTTTTTATLVAAIPVGFTLTPVAVKCFNDANGSITVNLNANQTDIPYQYQITAAPAAYVGVLPSALQTSNVFTGLPAGNYTIQAFSGRACPGSVSTTIATPLQLNGSYGLPNPLYTCTNNSLNTITVTINETVGTGTAPYQYSINGGAYTTTNTFNLNASTLAPTNFTYSIKDANGCIFNSNGVIPQVNALTATVTQFQQINCNQNEIVTINAVGGITGTTYTYSSLNATNVIAGPGANQFTISAPGTYYFRVTDDISGCWFDTVAYVVPTFNNLGASLSTQTHVSCNGGNNGVLNLFVSGYTGPYHYTVTNTITNTAVVGFTNIAANTVPNNPLLISGLPAGSYTVTVTEDNLPLCDFTTSLAVINQPTNLVVTPVLVKNDNSCTTNGGSIRVDAAGGTPGYTYQLLPLGSVAPTAASAGWLSTNTFSVEYNAINPNFTAYVKDANNCIANANITLLLDPDPTVSVAALAKDQCALPATNYTFTVTNATGVGQLSYSIDGVSFNPITAVPFDITVPVPNSPTSYTVTVRDANGCKVTAAPITIYPPLSLGNKIDTLTSCTNGDGQITVTAAGGSGNYSYALTTPAGPTNVTGIFNGLSHSIPYTFTVTDTTTGCTATTTVTIAPPTLVTLASVPTTTQVSCSGASDGTITVTLANSNDNPPYKYALIAPSQVVRPMQDSNIFIGLPTGNYTVEVTSGRGCKTTAFVNVGTPQPITVNTPIVTEFQCNPGFNVNNSASIQVNSVSGGSGNYIRYDFILNGNTVQSSPSNTYTSSAILGGTYTINVYDDKNCVGSTKATINPFISISNPVITVTNKITCVSTESISVAVTTTGGVAPTYDYSIDKMPTTAGYPQVNKTGIFTGLTIGDYKVTVTNPVTGCSVQKIHYVQDPKTFNLIAANPVDVKCLGDANGSITLSVVDYNTPPNDATGFNYMITNNTTPLVINGTSPTAGPITVNGLTAGSYTVTATLINDPSLTNNTQCTVRTSFTISGPQTNLVLTTTSKPISCIPGTDGVIVASAQGGWGTYTYTINPVAGTQNTPGTFENLPVDNYTITVTDLKGCQRTSLVPLNGPTTIVPANPIADVQLRCFGVNDGTVTAPPVTGGGVLNGNYSYTLTPTNPAGLVSGPQPSPTFTNLGPGEYTITVIDDYKCQVVLPFKVLAATEIKAELTKVSNSQQCDTSRESLTLTVTGGVGNYQYATSLTNPTWINFVSPITFNSLPVGNYTYYVKDANNCQAVASNGVEIVKLDDFGIKPIADLRLNCSYDRTSVKAEAFGGEGGYVYTLTPGNIINTTGEFTNLGVGNYAISVASGDCTAKQVTFRITAPLEFTYEIEKADTKCSYSNDGSVTVTMNGVDGRQVQYWLESTDKPDPIPVQIPVQDVPSFPSFTINNLVGNKNYVIHVFTQPYVCSPDTGKSFKINRPSEVTATFAIVNEVCAEDDLGEIVVSNIAGGTAPYKVYYTSNSTVTPGGAGTLVTLGAGVTSHTFQGLDGGEYVVYIEDANLCTFSFKKKMVGSGDLYDPYVDVTYPCNPLTNAPMVRIEVKNKLDKDGKFPAGYEFQMDAFAVQTGANANIFLSTNPLYTAALTNPGNHTFFVYGPNNCDKLVKPDPTVINPLKPLNVVLSQSGLNTVMAVVTGGTGHYTYTFYGDNQVMQTGTQDTFIYYQQYNAIKVVVTDDSGCTVTMSKYFPYIPVKVPDVLTPDGNGQNDDWGPDFVDPTVYPRLVTKVYDRYGRLLATLPVGARWNGKYDGKELPSGDYWYVIKVDSNDGQEFVGHFTLYR